MGEQEEGKRQVMDEVLILICENCNNPLGIQKDLEKWLYHSGSFTCPDCKGENIVPDDLKENIRVSRDVGL